MSDVSGVASRRRALPVAVAQSAGQSQLLVKDTGKGQQLVALIVQHLPQLANCWVLLACSLL